MTGLRGPVSKPDDQRQRRNKPTSPLVLATTAGIAPSAPSTFLPATQAAWSAYWADEAARIARVAHLPMIEMFFEAMDDRARFRTAVLGCELVPGSQGQSKLNPLFSEIAKREDRMLQLSTRIGLTPADMVRLGISTMSAQRTLDDLNAVAEDDDVDDTDPRLAAAR